MNQPKKFLMNKKAKSNGMIVFEIIVLIIDCILAVVLPILAPLFIICAVLGFIGLIVSIVTSVRASKVYFEIYESGIRGIRAGIFKNIEFKYSFDEIEYIKADDKDYFVSVKAKNEEKEWRLALEGAKEAERLFNQIKLEK